MTETEQQYKQQLAEVVKHHKKMWVDGARNKIKAREALLQSLLDKYEVAQENITELLDGQMDYRFKRQADKDASLERYIDGVAKYGHLIDRTKREIEILRKNLPNEAE